MRLALRANARYASSASASGSPLFAGREVRSPYTDVSVDVPRGGLAPFVMERFAEYGELPAVTDVSSGETISFASMRAAVCSVASALKAKHNFGAGDTLALYSPNDVHYFTVSQAVASLGGCVTPINPLYEGKELEHQVHMSKATLMIAHPSVAHHAISAAARSNGRIAPGSVYVFGDGSAELDESIPKRARATLVPFEELLTAAPSTALPDASVDADSTVMLPFSSGTTGLPKGVELTHRNLVVNLRQLGPGEGAFYAPGDKCFCPLPFFHIYGNMVACNLAMLHGVNIDTAPRFDFAEFLTAVQTMKIQRAHLVPPIVLALAKEPVVDQFDLSSLNVILSAAAPLGSDLQLALSKRISCVVKQAWGMTEISPAGTVVPDDDYEAGSANSGPLVPNSRALIVDVESGEAIDPLTEGELWLAGPHVMKGYIENDEANARDLVDVNGTRFFKTGDIGHFDAKGRLYITDRLKELIKYKGFQVAPAELEDLIMGHPDVRDTCVVGVPDDVAGELPHARIVLQEGSAATEETIAAWVAEHVAPHKKLRGGIQFVDVIPKTASGKILRRVVRDEIAAETAAE